jgi:hypothetical protein
MPIPALAPVVRPPLIATGIADVVGLGELEIMEDGGTCLVILGLITAMLLLIPVLLREPELLGGLTFVEAVEIALGSTSNFVVVMTDCVVLAGDGVSDWVPEGILSAASIKINRRYQAATITISCVKRHS